MKQRIVGEGMDSNSDLIVEFNIVFPNSLSAQRKEYIMPSIIKINQLLNKRISIGS